MEGLVFIAIILIIVWYVQSKKTQGAGTKKNTIHTSKVSVYRQSAEIEADDVFYSWTEGDLNDMLKKLDKKTNLIDRHFLLMGIVDQTYKERNDSGKGSILRRAAEMHLSEFEKIKPALKKDMGGTLPRVTTYQKYATFLTEQGEWEKAINVCEQAIKHGLHDGTKSGFEGRILRIKKKMNG